MKLLLYIPVFIILFAGCIQAQTPKNDCDCEANLQWVRQTFEKNDAGFNYALSQKGKDAYEAHNRSFEKRIKKITKQQDCFTALYDWLRFFRAGHIAIRPKVSTNDQQAQPSKEAIIAQYKDWERFEMTEAQLQQRLAKLKKPGLEGIWVSPPYKIGVVKKDKGYIGFIIEADGAYWRPGQVKLKIEPSTESAQYKAKFFMRNHSLVKFDRVQLFDGNIMTMGFITLKRDKAKLSKDAKLAWQLAKTKTPMLKRLSKKTLVLRIPSFNGANKKVIDSVLKANHKAITSTKNLIIDIKNGTGGSDRSYQGILPYLYTNPIRSEGVAFYSTPLNNSRMDKLAAMAQFSRSEKKWFKKGKKKLDAKLGQFVNLNDAGKTYSMTTYNKVYEYPKNVAIIINKGNGSTDEQFLLAAKQSRKVKLFGATTFGVLDISNMHFVLSPCKQFELGYCLTKSYRIPHMAIDGKGIQPDYALSGNIHELEWLREVQKIVERW
ncbi:hypothetical protein BKI52_13405 [marine bacterium AO1-C]|nr:hypothetical protein BKI52_13405 [marine bacterium AO1-C]